MDEFTATSLPVAIKTLLEMNNYEVSGPEQINGAEIDLIAVPLSDPFGSKLYIEVTIEHVNNTKYGKDLTKLAMLDAIDPDGKKIIISSKGFSLPVKERAKNTRISVLTYDELFQKFERFEKYIRTILEDTQQGQELRSLNDIYEEPFFEDSYGRELATPYLDTWRCSKDSTKGWLVVTGEYGTGKTALTKILQYRWLQEYKKNPQLPLPIRIELREFSKQFDARGLLHHFLDFNQLGHVSIEFLVSLIRAGRAVLLLDGYDEMAQYMHARERRACLEALADLSTGGARGILTSRPNYFTEAEELQVFEILYSSLQQGRYLINADAKKILEQEKQVDDLLAQFIDRYERVLRDLSPEQTESLISRVLASDPDGKQAVLGILQRIFRSLESGDSVSLSGKPVIVSYLLEVVEGLKGLEENDRQERLTEWQIYKLIIDQLMLRDLRRSPEIMPDVRRQFLRKIAMYLSKRENALVDEHNFRDMITKEFKRELNRLPVESRHQQIERYFADLRASATLTRAARADVDGWHFSHNSLREFLVAEYILQGNEKKVPVLDQVSISDAMKTFVSSLSDEEKRKHLDYISAIWKQSGHERGKGQLLALLWEAILSLFLASDDNRRKALNAITGDPPTLQDITISRTTFSSERRPSDLTSVTFQRSVLSDIDFSGATLDAANFTGTTLETCNFTNANLDDSLFNGAFIVDANFSGSSLKRANFENIEETEITILIDSTSSDTVTRLEGFNALGYLRFSGATTKAVDQYFVIQHHPKFPVVDKIIEKLAEQSIRQRRGLEQRGAARQDIKLAKEFVHHLEQHQLLAAPKNRKELVEVTEAGREMFNEYIMSKHINDVIYDFFSLNEE